MNYVPKVVHDSAVEVAGSKDSQNKSPLTGGDNVRGRTKAVKHEVLTTVLTWGGSHRSVHGWNGRRSTGCLDARPESHGSHAVRFKCPLGMLGDPVSLFNLADPEPQGGNRGWCASTGMRRLPSLLVHQSEARDEERQSPDASRRGAGTVRFSLGKGPGCL